MKKFKLYISKWNWGGFGFLMILSALGLASNLTINSAVEWFTAMVVVGLPLSLAFAWITKDE